MEEDSVEQQNYKCLSVTSVAVVNTVDVEKGILILL